MPEYTTEFSFTLESLSEFGIWTGDVDMNMSGIKTTSLLGGMRFWTEALLRSLGQDACNNQKRCKHQKRCNHKASEAAKICSGCRIFGCTGLSREFSLKVFTEENKLCRKDDNHFRYPPGKHNTVRMGYTQPFTLRLSAHRRPLDGGEPRLSPFMVTALLLMVEYGTVGAGDQNGCGLVRFRDKGSREALASLAIRPSSDGTGSVPPAESVSLRDFFFFKGKVRDALPNRSTKQAIIDSTKKAVIDLRMAVRKEIKTLGDKDSRYWFCGYLDQQRKDSDKFGSKYNLSIARDGKLYGWGYFPRQPSGIDAKWRDPILEKTKEALMVRVDGLQWKEFGSARDSCGSPKDWGSYLEDMIAARWRTA